MAFKRCLHAWFRGFLVFVVVSLTAIPAFGEALDLAPSNPLALPASGSDARSLYLDGRMLRDVLPLPSNLEFGYRYYFGDNNRTGRLSIDYLLPIGLGDNAAIFGEAHGDFTNFWKTIYRVIQSGNTTTTEAGFDSRTDLSFGMGFRKIVNGDLFLGVNGFYDATQLSAERWYGSGSVGFEMAALVAGSDALDLNLNIYGNLFQGRDSIVNAFRNGPTNFDLELGYSHEMGAEGPDLRINVTAYKFDIGTPIYGWKAGAEVLGRNGMFSVKVEAGRDEINEKYYSVGGFVNVGVRLERLLHGRNPFTMPEPLFRSPRNLRRLLTRKVRRNYFQPVSVIKARQMRSAPKPPPGCQVIIVATSNLTAVLPPNVGVINSLTPNVDNATYSQATEVLIEFTNPTPNWTGTPGRVRLYKQGGILPGPEENIPPNSTSMTVTNPSFWTWNPFLGSRIIYQMGVTNGIGGGNWNPGVVTVTFRRCP